MKHLDSQGWGKRVGSGLVLVLATAFVARVAWTLLAPVVPFVAVLLLLLAVGGFVVGRRR